MKPDPLIRVPCTALLEAQLLRAVRALTKQRGADPPIELQSLAIAVMAARQRANAEEKHETV